MEMEKISLLDHGYIALVETWGSDERIIEAARMSTDKGFKGWGTPTWSCQCGYKMGASLFTPTATKDRPSCPVSIAHVMSYNENPGDEKLLKYLYNHKHMTPFEMAGMTLEIQAPIFVFREWHRHRTQSYNELSARYTPLPDVNYLPSVQRLMLNSKTNKQAGTVKDAAELTEGVAEDVRKSLQKIYVDIERLYQLYLQVGVPKELARLPIPVARYSRMRASANLRNWLGFLTLRMDPAAQWEIRQYAGEVAQLIAGAFPRTYALFNPPVTS